MTKLMINTNIKFRQKFQNSIFLFCFVLKVIAIDLYDYDSRLLNDIQDVEMKWPGLLDFLRYR